MNNDANTFLQTEVKVAKMFTLEMAHALPDHKGLCRNIHGHSYRLEIVVSGIPKQAPGLPDDGMVIDFAHLKQIVSEKIISVYDHSCVLREDDLARFPGIDGQTKLNLVPFTPTCELLLLHFRKILIGQLSQAVRLHSIRLYETATSYAEWTG